MIVALAIVEFSLRALGLLFVAPSGSGPGEGRNILCVGDSWTHGLQSVSYGEALETKLNTRFGQGAFQVARSGVPGCNSSQGREHAAGFD